MNRAYNIALLARRLHLIATRPEFRNEQQVDRLDRTLTEDAPGALSLPDAMLIIGASELDRMLGYAVAVMSRKGGRIAEVLDVLGMLNPDSICAVYYALPEERRTVVTRDPVWAYHVSQLDQDEMQEALAWAAEARTPVGPVVAALTRAVFGAAPEAVQAA